MNLLLTSNEDLQSTTKSYIEASGHFGNNQTTKKLEEMNLLVASTEENTHHAIHPFIYGFIVFLVFCILVSLGKVIYYYYNMTVESISETAESTNTDRPTMLRRRLDNAEISDSDWLRAELGKLRMLCNEGNCMINNAGSIADIPVPSTSYIDNSRPSSSDYDTLWSSIDCDDFEQSFIYENITRKVLSEGSISAPISENSNFSKIRFQNICPKKAVRSSEEYSPRTTFSECSHLPIPSPNQRAQIRPFLDAFETKNANSEFSFRTPSVLNDTKASSLAESEDPRTSPSASESGDRRTSPSAAESRTSCSTNYEDPRTSSFSEYVDSTSSPLFVRENPGASCYGESVAVISPIPLAAQSVPQEIDWNTPLNHEATNWRTPTLHKVDTRRIQHSSDTNWRACALTLSLRNSRETVISDTVLPKTQATKSVGMRTLSSESLSPTIQLSSESFIRRTPIPLRMLDPDEMKWSTPLSHDIDALRTPLVYKTSTQKIQLFPNERTWLTPPPPEATSRNSSEGIDQGNNSHN